MRWAWGTGQTNRGSDLGKTMDSLEVPMTEVNREKLENMIKEHYNHSAFNVCPHHELPVMTGDPLRIVVDPRVKPYAMHKPVPLHWKDTIREQMG